MGGAQNAVLALFVFFCACACRLRDDVVRTWRHSQKKHQSSVMKNGRVSVWVESGVDV